MDYRSYDFPDPIRSMQAEEPAPSKGSGSLNFGQWLLVILVAALVSAAVTILILTLVAGSGESQSEPWAEENELPRSWQSPDEERSPRAEEAPRPEVPQPERPGSSNNPEGSNADSSASGADAPARTPALTEDDLDSEVMLSVGSVTHLELATMTQTADGNSYSWSPPRVAGPAVILTGASVVVDGSGESQLVRYSFRAVEAGRTRILVPQAFSNGSIVERQITFVVSE